MQHLSPEVDIDIFGVVTGVIMQARTDLAQMRIANPLLNSRF